MPLFMGLGKKLSQTGQDVVKNTKGFTESARVNARIAEEQKQIQGLYFELGKVFYETFGTDAEEPLLGICQSISTSYERIAVLDAEAARLKGFVRCTSCGSDIPSDFSFCGHCGSPAPPPPAPPHREGAKNFCPGCGCQLTPKAAFCTSCGIKL